MKLVSFVSLLLCLSVPVLSLESNAAVPSTKKSAVLRRLANTTQASKPPPKPSTSTSASSGSVVTDVTGGATASEAIESDVTNGSGGGGSSDENGDVGSSSSSGGGGSGGGSSNSISAEATVGPNASSRRKSGVLSLVGAALVVGAIVAAVTLRQKRTIQVSGHPLKGSLQRRMQLFGHMAKECPANTRPPREIDDTYTLATDTEALA